MTRARDALAAERRRMPWQHDEPPEADGDRPGLVQLRAAQASSEGGDAA